MEGDEYRYTAFFEPAEEGGYVVVVPALPGCVTQGESFEEAKAHAKEAILGYLETLRQQGDPIPVEENSLVEAIEVNLSRA